MRQLRNQPSQIMTPLLRNINAIQTQLQLLDRRQSNESDTERLDPKIAYLNIGQIDVDIMEIFHVLKRGEF